MWDGVATSIGSFFGVRLLSILPTRLSCVFGSGHRDVLRLHVNGARRTCLICGRSAKPLLPMRADAIRLFFDSARSMK